MTKPALTNPAKCTCGTEGPVWRCVDIHQHGCAVFACSICGEQCPISPVDGPTFCEKHCPDHQYYYEPGEGHRCDTCFAEPPADWFDVEEDYALFGDDRHG